MFAAIAGLGCGRTWRGAVLTSMAARCRHTQLLVRRRSSCVDGGGDAPLPCPCPGATGPPLTLCWLWGGRSGHLTLFASPGGPSTAGLTDLFRSSAPIRGRSAANIVNVNSRGFRGDTFARIASVAVAALSARRAPAQVHGEGGNELCHPARRDPLIWSACYDFSIHMLSCAAITTGRRVLRSAADRRQRLHSLTPCLRYEDARGRPAHHSERIAMAGAGRGAARWVLGGPSIGDRSSRAVGYFHRRPEEPGLHPVSRFHLRHRGAISWFSARSVSLVFALEEAV